MPIHIRKKKDIKFWYWNMRVNGHRHRGWFLPTSHMTKRQAQAEYDRIKAELITGYSPLKVKKRLNGSSLSKRVFKNYLDYLQLHHPSTYSSVKHIKHFAFFHKLNDIKPTDITIYQKKRLKQRAKNSTINRELQYCRSAFNRAIEHGLTDTNPFVKFDKFVEYERTRYLTEHEITALLHHAGTSCNPHLKTIVETGILTGLRKTEILTLHKNNLDFKLGFIIITPEIEKNNKRKQIPIPAPLISDFQRLLDASKQGYLFENPHTGRHYTDVKRAFKTALKAAGISDFHFHDLRHTFATYALLVSKDIRTVQVLLGHKRIETTQKYAHVLGEQKTDTIAKLSTMISNLTG